MNENEAIEAIKVELKSLSDSSFDMVIVERNVTQYLQYSAKVGAIFPKGKITIEMINALMNKFQNSIGKPSKIVFEGTKRELTSEADFEVILFRVVVLGV